MLVNRKQEWEFQEEIIEPAIQTPAALQVNFNLRSKCFTIGILVAVMAMLVTVQSEMIVRSGYDLVDIKKQITQLERDNEQLRLDIAKLKSPQRIQNIADKELGMVLPQKIYRAAVAGLSENPKTGGKAATDKYIGMLQVNGAEGKETH